MRFIELFSGIGGFRYGLEACNREQQEDAEVGGCRDSGEPEEQQPKQPSERGNDIGRDTCDSPNSKGGTSQYSKRSFRCVWANDNDKYASQIYRKNFGGEELYEGDIRTVDPSIIPEHELLCAGFPCQSFSIAGKRGGFEDTRGTLFFEICRILRAKRTPYVWLENVKGLLSHDNGDTFQTILGTLDELGYDCQWEVLNSKNFGVPQNRERVFIIGHLRGQPRPKVFPLGENNISLDENGYRGKPDAVCYEIDSNYGKGCFAPGRTNQRTMVRTRSNQKYKESGVSTPLRQSDKAEVRIMLRDGQDIHGIQVANCLDADGYLRTGARPRDENGKPQLLPIGYRRIRRLTPTECERLQGFPDGWTEGISDTQRYKCLGNAVTTNVITAIGNAFD